MTFVLGEISPSLDEAKEASLLECNRGKNVIPIFKEVMADLFTPVAVYLKLRGHTPSFLLESIEGGKQVARYSFVGSDPFKVYETGMGKELSDDPLVYLEREMSKHKMIHVPGLVLPDFTGGAVGYVSYDAVRHFEPRVEPYIGAQTDVLGLPESRFMLCNTVVVFDHVRRTMKVVSHCRLDTDDLTASYAEAAHNIETVLERLLDPAVPTPHHPHPGKSSSSSSSSSGDDSGQQQQQQQDGVSANVDQSDYEEFVRRLKGHIVDGDIIQAVPSRRLRCPLPQGVTAFELYRQQRVINPSPYMFYLDFTDFQIVGASPEMLVKVQGGRVETHPIAGTRRRGKTQEEDDAVAAELLSDPKERAEHVMLVDLGRNDVGRVAAAGSVRVESLMHVERYSHVMHIVSVVTGRLHPQKTAYDALRSIFPAGTVSGAPKVRAMELVAGCEKERRGVYAGAVGYVGFDGTLDTAIAIRTMLVKDGSVYLQAGGGITYDSQETPEYQETVNKLAGAMAAVQQAANMAAPPKRKMKFDTWARLDDGKGRVSTGVATTASITCSSKP